VPQFLIVARDGTDAGAHARRMAARAAHFDYIRPFVEAGRLSAGGAILDDHGAMVGSALIVDFPDRDAFDAWLANDPYVVQKVWQRIEVTPFRLAVLDGKTTP